MVVVRESAMVHDDREDRPIVVSQNTEEPAETSETSLTIPPIPSELPGDETNRVRERSLVRTKATKQIKRISDLYENPDCKADDLAWHIHVGEELIDEMLKIKITAKEPESSHHIDSLREIIFKGKRRLAKLEKSEDSASSQPSKPPPTESFSATTSLTYQLQQLKLPSFDGDVEEWPTFIQTFSYEVDRLDVPGTAKLICLRRLLSGEALRAIKGLSNTDANYQVAVNILQKRFALADKRTDILMKRLIQAPGLTPSCPPKQLREAVDTIVSTVRELEAHGVSSESYGIVVRPILEEKLSQEWSKGWARRKKNNGGEATLSEFVTYLEDEIEILEAAQRNKNNDHPGHHQASSQHPGYATPSQPRRTPIPAPRRSRPATTSALPSAVSRPQPVAERKCKLCRGDLHGYAKCTTFQGMNPKQRLDAVIEANLCQNCLGPHRINFCPSNRGCGNCQRRHNTMLCQMTPVRPAPPPPPAQPTNLAGPIVNRGSASTELNPYTYSMTAVAVVTSPRGEQWNVRLMFDSGSDLSYCRSSLVQRMGLPKVGEAQFVCTGFQERREPLKTYDLVKIALSSTWGSEIIYLNLWRSDSLCCPLKRRVLPCHPDLTGLPLADDLGEGEVDILIGTDYFYQLMGNAQISLSPSLRAIETLFGWVIHGRGDSNIAAPLTTRRCNVSALWDLESIGIVPEPEDVVEPMPIPSWNEEEGKVEVGLLWKGESRPVPNLDSSKTRVTKMINRLRLDQKLLYDEYIENKMKERVIDFSPVTWQSLPNQFLLPHRAIFDRKFRVVFDGSARDGSGKPLNSYMKAGPNLLPKLLTVLVRFRAKAVGFQADVQGAFHQILLPEEDRPFVQFTYDSHIFHFRRVPFGLICSPALLHSSINFLLNRAEDILPGSSPVISTLREGLYFDDEAGGFDTLEEARKGIKEAVKIFDLGGMALHKIRTSGDQIPPSKVLGLTWDTSTDNLSIPLSFSLHPMTKRDLLSYLGKIWDPLGVLSPWTIRGRILFQQTWSLGTDWNDLLPADLQRGTDLWLSETETTPFQFPRLCATYPFSLDCFVDSSQLAYCATVYLVNQEGERNLLTAKSRLAPLSRNLSIPRLELLSALIGARLVSTCTRALEGVGTPTSIRFFSDSEDVLYWLQRRKPMKIFVDSRVKEILTLSSLEQWHYIQTKRNPADLGTRGIPFHDLAFSHLWWHGPTFETSPTAFFITHAPVSAKEEEKDLPPQALVTTAEPPPALDPLFDLSSVSNLKSLIHRTSWIFRLFWNGKRGVIRKLQPYLDPEEMSAGLNYWIKFEQKRWFGDDLPYTYRRLKPFRRDGIIYTEPRTGEPALILLPPNSLLTTLIVQDAHQKMFHQGPSATGSCLSAKYHVSRRTIKHSLRQCRPCRRFRGKTPTSQSRIH